MRTHQIRASRVKSSSGRIISTGGLLLLLALAWAGCAKHPKMIEADKSYDGRTLTFHVGDTLNLSLAENPTTGFRWDLKTKPEPQFEAVTDTFENSGGSPGAGGTHHWQWKATRTGAATIRLEYRRPWETNAPPG